MSAALEISEGIPLDGRRFETPPASLDHQKPRYVATVANFIDRQMMRDKPWTKGGGLIVANPCLRYVKNFLRKGRITPVLKDTHDYRPLDLQRRASEGDTSYFPQPIPPGYVPPSLPEGAGPAKHGYMVGKIVLPGEQINAIVEGSAAIAHGGMRRGVVEIRSLKGEEYRDEDFEFNGSIIHTDKTIWQIQRAIFPDYPRLPNLIDDVGRLLDDAAQHTSIRDIVDDFRLAWEQFREFANVTIRHTHMTMREIAGASHGYIPTYTALDLILLEQLGLARQDEEIRKNSAPSSDPELSSMFKQFIALQIEEKEALKAQRLRAEGISESTMAASQIDAGYSGAEGQSGYSGFSGQSGEVVSASADLTSTDDLTCECGKSYALKKALDTHQRFHCELRKVDEASSTDIVEGLED